MAASSSKRGKGGKGGGGGGGGGGKLTPSQKGASQAVLLLIIGLPGSGKVSFSFLFSLFSLSSLSSFFHHVNKLFLLLSFFLKKRAHYQTDW